MEPSRASAGGYKNRSAARANDWIRFIDDVLRAHVVTNSLKPAGRASVPAELSVRAPGPRGRPRVSSQFSFFRKKKYGQKPFTCSAPRVCRGV